MIPVNYARQLKMAADAGHHLDTSQYVKNEGKARAKTVFSCVCSCGFSFQTSSGFEYARGLMNHVAEVLAEELVSENARVSSELSPRSAIS